MAGWPIWNAKVLCHRAELDGHFESLFSRCPAVGCSCLPNVVVVLGVYRSHWLHAAFSGAGNNEVLFAQRDDGGKPFQVGCCKWTRDGFWRTVCYFPSRTASSGGGVRVKHCLNHSLHLVHID
ncbi:unannotated protein [freshwater metagenome]|uniref:Unannotated protein n=1 Tax=freshwater metagenome TaxID=449393 RepID=A0A6J7DB31_9ZZZZ